MSTEQKEKKPLIEFDDLDVTMMDFIQELDDQQYIASINSMAKLIAKHSKNPKLTFMDLMKMKLSDFNEISREFCKKKGLESQYDFLAK